MASTNPLRDFENALITARVASKFVEAKDFPTEDALRQYLKDHPKADPKNHKVTLIGDYKREPKKPKPYVPLTHQYPKHRPKPTEAEKVAARFLASGIPNAITRLNQLSPREPTEITSDTEVNIPGYHIEWDGNGRGPQAPGARYTLRSDDNDARVRDLVITGEAENEAGDDFGSEAREEKRGEWNLVVRKYSATRWSYYLKNPVGGGGGSSSYPNPRAAIAAAIGRGVNDTMGKDKVWVIIQEWDPAAERYRTRKTYWETLKAGR